MKYPLMTPDQLRPGDRIPNIDGDGPAVVSVGEPYDTTEFGTCLDVELDDGTTRQLPDGPLLVAVEDTDDRLEENQAEDDTTEEQDA